MCLISKKSSATGWQAKPERMLIATAVWPTTIGSRKELWFRVFHPDHPRSGARYWWSDLLPAWRKLLLSLEWETVEMKSPLEMLARAAKEPESQG